MHQCLLALLDSQVNKAGKLRVLVRTKKGVLIKISPVIRLPRTYKRFSGLFAQLLTKMKICSAETHQPLLEVVNGGVASHVPKNAFIIGTSEKAKLIKDLDAYVKTAQVDDEKADGKPRPLCFVIGCSDQGDYGGTAHAPYLHDCISISHYTLSAQCVAQKVCFAAEEVWNI